MKLSVPHNWQDDLVDTVDFACVGEFYGKLEMDVVGGGRSANICLPVSQKKFQHQIQKIHKKGLTFNYLLNSSCLDNRELTRSIHRKLSKLIDWLEDSCVDSITVSLPYILRFIKKRHPNFKICVSTMAHVDIPDKAKFWEDMGVAKITLHEFNVNRNFKLIEKIRNSVKCQLQLIANNGCLCDCPFTVNHGLLCSHASQSGHISDGFIIDFYRIICSYMRIKDPVNFIRSDWIRPEDVSLYEGLGIDYLKIVNRGMTSGTIRDIVKAYSRRNYEGNLLDLLPGPPKNINYKKYNLWHLFRFFFHPCKVNIFKLVKIKEIFEDSAIYIDNKKLDGFLVSLQEKNCGSMLCADCNWCRKIADETVKFNAERVNSAIKKNEELLAELISGKFFRYF